jgi:ATP-dependent Zn protease
MKNYQTTGVLITGLLLISVLFASTLLMNQSSTKVQELNYSEFIQKLEAGDISRVIVEGQEVEAISKPVIPDAVKANTDWVNSFAYYPYIQHAI